MNNDTPYGFKRDDGEALEPVEAEQEVIKLIKKYRAEGLPLEVINEELRLAGILSNG